MPLIPSIPIGVDPPTGGPDPYLYFSSIQASPGQTAVVTLYLDITDPNGVPLAALDEAIGYDPAILQISNIRGASALEGIAGYSTVGTADNQTGVLLVGQAFAGSGLPPLLPFGTNIAVLQFDVTVNADAPVGSSTTLTLLHDGTINGQDKVTAISDDDGALTFTPGKVPTNAGNPAVDGTLTVIPVAPPPIAASSPVASPHEVSPTAVKPVRRAEPATSTLVTQTPEQMTIDTEAAAVPVSVPALPITVVAESRTVDDGAAPPSVVATPIPGEAPSALVSARTAAPAPGSPSDAGTALSLVAQATTSNPSFVPGPAAGPSGSTVILDEIYRRLPTGSPNVPMSGTSVVPSDSLIAERSTVWYMVPALVDLDLERWLRSRISPDR